MTSIGDEAFYFFRRLTSITIPDSVTSIGERAFASCRSLTSITIPTSVTSIGDRAFDSCQSLEDVYYSGNSDEWQGISIGTDNQYLTDANLHYNVTDAENHYEYIEKAPGLYEKGECGYYCSCGFSKDVIEIPSLGGIEFTYTISNGCATITDFDTSFGGDVTIPSTLDGYSVTSIGDGAFTGCKSLTSITIPRGVTSIGNETFKDCTSLTSITIPDSVTSIGNNAFYGCAGLTSITIPDGVTSIRNGTFSGCGSLTSINLPDGVTSIGYNAFSGCISLTSITIPDGVTSIGDWAFENCTSLNDVYYAGSVADWNNISIDSSNSELTSAERFHYNVTNSADHYEYTVITEPGCTDGKAQYTCPCGYTWYEVIPALGHDIVYHDGKAPTCTEPGFEAHETCTRCDYTTYVEIPATGHTYEDGVCTICGKRDPNAVILGDANGDGVVNAVDSTLISRKLSGWTVDIDSAAADVNGDGLVDAKDVTLINRKLSGWSVDF